SVGTSSKVLTSSMPLRLNSSRVSRGKSRVFHLPARHSSIRDHWAREISSCCFMTSSYGKKPPATQEALLYFGSTAYRTAEEPFIWGLKSSILGTNTTLMVFEGWVPSAGGCCSDTLILGTPPLRK